MTYCRKMRPPVFACAIVCLFLVPAILVFFSACAGSRTTGPGTSAVAEVPVEKAARVSSPDGTNHEVSAQPVTDAQTSGKPAIDLQFPGEAGKDGHTTVENEGPIPLDNISRIILDNGMTVLVKEDHSSPVATINIWVKTGYFNETDEWTGISHLLEHMFSKGTPTRKVGQIKDEIKACGGISNAATIYDHTNFYALVPSSEIGHVMEIEADALLNATFLQEELDKEQEVVVQEVLRKYDRPDAMVWERMIDLAFTEHHLGRWRMGSPEQIRAMDREVLVGYYLDRYRPENIVVVVVGDVNSRAVQEDIRRLFGSMPRGTLRHYDSPPEPPQTELRYRQETADVSQAYLAIGFHAPAVLSEDEAAVQVLADLLGSGKSSRLYRALKERAGLVDTISTEYYPLPGVGVCYIQAELNANALEAAREGVFTEIAALVQQPPSASELEKIKTRLEYSFMSSLEEVRGQSSMLAQYEALGDYHLIKVHMNKLRAVTPADVQRVAGEYLRIEKASIQELRPTGIEGATNAAQVAASLRKTATSATTMPGLSMPGLSMPGLSMPGPSAEPSPILPAEVRSAEAVERPQSLHTLKNGLTVLIRERHRLPLASVVLAFPGGRLEEDEATAGLTGLALQASLKGTTGRSAEELQNQLETLGTSISVSAQPDFGTLSFDVLARNLVPALEILADVVHNPTVPPEEIEKERRAQLARIARYADSMRNYPIILADSAAFGSHPYGLPSFGLEASVVSLSRDQVITHHRGLVRADGAVMVVVGDVDSVKILAELERYFGTLEAGATARPQSTPPAFTAGERVVTRNKAQSAQAFAFPAPPADAPDVPALNVLRNIASGLGGRIYDQVREKHNLAYTVVALVELNRMGGLIVNYAATSPENEEKARAMILDEWAAMAGGDISEEDFLAARRYTIGTYQIGLQTNSDLAGTYVTDYFMGLGFDDVERYPERVQAVTLEDVKRAAADYAAPGGFALGVVRAGNE